MFNSKISQELTVMTKNQAGSLGLILEALHQKGIVLHSIVGRVFNGQAYFYIVTADATAAQKVLKAAPSLSELMTGIEMRDVIALTSDQEMTVPMVRFTSLLAQKGVEIDHCYSTYVSGNPVFVLATADNKLALRLTAEAGVAA